MNQLNIPFLPLINKASNVTEVSSILDTLDKTLINIAPWPEYNYMPKASFAIGHGYDCIFVKYYVQEDAISALYRTINDPVYKDTCVELFITFNDDKHYYNFEFNCLGTCLAGYGTGRDERKLLPEKIIRKINYQAQFKTTYPAGEDAINWELTLIIPFDAFCYDEISTLQNTTCRANFYKCGDDLPVPHFLAWNNIQSPEPNFHLPEFFGEAHFMDLTD